MPVYTVKDNQTGKTIKFNWSGQGQPGEQDFQQVFQQARDFAPGPSGDMGKDAQTFASGMGDEAKQFGEGLVNRVGNVLGFHPSQGDYIPEGLNPMVGAYNATKQDLGGLPDFIRREVDLAKKTFMKGDPESGGRLTTQALAALLGGRVLGKTGVGQAVGEAGAAPFRAAAGAVAERLPQAVGAAKGAAAKAPIVGPMTRGAIRGWQEAAPQKGLPPPPSAEPGMPQSSASGPVSAAPEPVGPPIDLPLKPPAAARRAGPAGPPNSASGPVSGPPPGEAPPIDLNVEGASAAPPQALPPPPKLGPQPPQARVQYWFQRALKQYPGAPPAKLMEGARQMALDEMANETLSGIKQGEASAAGMGTGAEGLPARGRISTASPTGRATGQPGGEAIAESSGGSRGAWRTGDPVLDPQTRQMVQPSPEMPVKPQPFPEERLVTPEELAQATRDLEILSEQLRSQNPGWAEGVQGPGLPWDPKILLREE